MTNNRKNGNTRSLLGALATAVVVLVAALVSLFGGDFSLEDLEDVTNVLNTVVPALTPGAEASTAPATVVPPTARPTLAPVPTLNAASLVMQQGYSASDRFWQVFFTAPTGSRNPVDYVGGVDVPLAQAILAARGTIDIAAFEFNNPLLTQALLQAHQNGVQVRMVADNDYGVDDEDSTIPQLIAAGIPVVDDGRSALMHHKFVIIDGTTVWMGSLNYTVNGVYRNNNNLLALRSRRTVEAYQATFNEMFVNRGFGPRATGGNGIFFNQDGTPIQVMFSPKDDVVNTISGYLENATSSVRFMAFSFTLDPLGEILQQRAGDGVEIQGIFETAGSLTRFSEMSALFCMGVDVRQDGNPFVMHHKVFILDEETVVTGSFNFSDNATTSNDENMVIIRDKELAAQYLEEFERRWAEANIPQSVECF